VKKALQSAAFFLLAAACTQGRPQRAPRSEGERVYLAKCAGCHRVYEPHEYPPEKWVGSVASMERNKRVRLDPEQRALILGYLSGTAP